MAPRAGSYSQPQVHTRRSPLAGKTDSATNRQAAPAPRKALSEHKPSKAIPRRPPITPAIIVSENATSKSGTGSEYPVAIGIATSDNDPRSSNVAPQTSSSSRAARPCNNTTHQSSGCEPPTKPTRSALAVPNYPIPHHDSVPVDEAVPSRSVLFEPNGGEEEAAVANTDKRITALREEGQRDEKRGSLSSEASTGLQSKRHYKGYIGPWQLGKDLGSGATGRVRLARHRVTGHLVAMKIVTRRAAAAMQSQSLVDMSNEVSTTKSGQKEIPVGIEREVIMMRLLDHPSVIKLYDVWESRGELWVSPLRSADILANKL